MNNKYFIVTIVILSLIMGVTYYASFKEKQSRQVSGLGSVDTGSEYYSTSTRSFNGTVLTNFTVIKSSRGTFGGLLVTGANTGEQRFYDATTSNVSLRTGNKATSSLTVVIYPASLAAGYYPADVIFNNGILYELVSGLAPTSTVFWR